MDGSGKDGVIRNVMGNMNPQGVTVRSYKARLLKKPLMIFSGGYTSMRRKRNDTGV
jgi:hypothetical protein